MPKLSRRHLLAGGLSAYASVFCPKLLQASNHLPFGTIDPVTEEPIVWEGLPHKNYKILELFLPGGLSHWETFWVDLTNGNPDWKPGQAGYDAAMAATQWYCEAAGLPAEDTICFGNCGQSREIGWGPATHPLRHPALFDRTRMVVLKHSFLPHEVAVPYALTGTRLGSPRHAGSGSVIETAAQSNLRRAKPYSYVLTPQFMGFNRFVHSATATGRLPGASRPLRIKMGDTNLQDRLDRTHDSDATLIARQESADALFNSYRGQYRDLLRRRSFEDPLKSSGFSSYDASADALVRADALTELFPDARMEVTENPPYCVGHPQQFTDFGEDPVDNTTEKALNLARHLLIDGDARYVMVYDSGLEQPGGAPYDTHSGDPVETPEDFVRITTGNLYNALKHLVDQIDLTGGSDPSKINLNDTMVVINSEFSRTVTPEGSGGVGPGRNHEPRGYVGLYIGGPVNSRSVTGSIDLSTGVADDSVAFNHADYRAGIYLASGIKFMEPTIFGTTDFTDRILNPGSEAMTMQNVRRDILGIS